MRTWRGAAAMTAVLALTAPSVRAESSAERRIRVLEDTLRQATDEIKQLRKEVQQQKAVGAATSQQASQAEEKAKAVETATKSAIDLPGWLKKVTLFGDVRLRHEGFYHQPHNDGDLIGARNRERLRVRLGAKIVYSDELSATIRIATGDPSDPISTNETLNGSFNPKHINLDQGYVTFTPGKSFDIRPGSIAFTGGRFPLPIFKVGEMVFDDDLNGEGLAESFALLPNPIGPLDQLKIHMMQLTFSEISNSQDGWMIGGQVNPSGHFGDWLLEGGVGQYWWLNADQIATSFNSNKVLKNTNVVEIADDKGNIRTDATGFAKLGKGETFAGYAGAFNQTQATVALTHPTLVYGKPLKVFADYVYNWEAFGDDAQGVQAGVKVGQPKAKGDLAFTAFYEYLGQEAALSTFSYSDFGFGGTNQQGPVVGVEYQLLDPLTISVKNHFTNLINRPDGYRNATLFRLQLDALVKF